jgi:hypothetical protein
MRTDESPAIGFWGGEYPGDLGQLSRIVLVTIARTNGHIRRHPLRGSVVGRVQALSDDQGEPVVPAFALNAPKALVVIDLTW